MEEEVLLQDVVPAEGAGDDPLFRGRLPPPAPQGPDEGLSIGPVEFDAIGTGAVLCTPVGNKLRKGLV